MSGEITNEPPPSRSIAAWNDDSVRNDGLRNSSDSTLPSSARGSGFASSRAASAMSSLISSREKSARSLKRSIGQFLQGLRQALHVFGREYQRRQEPQHVGVGARADEDVAREQGVADGRGLRSSLQAEQEAATLNALDVSDPARRADGGADVANVGAQIVARDDVDDGLDRRAGDGAAAERRAEGAGFQVLRDAVRHQDGAAREASAQAFRDGQKIGAYAVQLRAEWRSEPTHARLDLVENQQRARAVACRTDRMEELRREIEGARQALHGLDDDGRRARVDGCVESGHVVARHERDVERRAREAVPRLHRAVGDGGCRGRPAMEAVLHRDDLAAARDLEREPQRVLVRLGAAVDEKDAT